MNTKEEGRARREKPTPSETAPQRTKPADAGREPDRSRRPGSPDQVQQTLDDALADSFPASDPVSIVTSQHEEAWDEARDTKR